MITEYKNDKTALLSALEQADSNLNANTSVYAVVATEDPVAPFEICMVQEPGSRNPEMKTINERLFDRAFLDFGYKEVLGPDNLEGTVYAPIEELFTKENIIGVAPRDFFDQELSSYRMARGAEEDADDEDSLELFPVFLKLVDERVIDGKPQRQLETHDLSHVCGFLFKYATGDGSDASCVVAFMRIMRMWAQNRSSFFLFEGSKGTAEPFASSSIRIGNRFDFLLHSNKVFLRNFRALEILFKFNKLLAQRAKDYADTLDPFIADFEKLDERIEASRGVATKLMKMQREGSPVAELAPEELEERVNRLPYYNRKLKFNEEGKIMLTTNREVNDLLRMLNDDYVVSPLTNEDYEARSKKPLKRDEE